MPRSQPGSRPRGRPRDDDRHRQILEWIHEGATTTEIAKRLGITRSAVSDLLGPGVPRSVFCRDCRARVGETWPGREWRRRPVYCQGCVAKRPDLPFGQRLLALRLSRGLTQVKLAKQAGVGHMTINTMERAPHPNPTFPVLLKLVRVLGPLLIGWPSEEK